MIRICCSLLAFVLAAPLSVWSQRLASSRPHSVRLAGSAKVVGFPMSPPSETRFRAKARIVKTDDGNTIYCREAGKGPAILFVPGWMMTTAIWEPQLEHFSKTHRAVAMDPRGQGRSDKPPDGYFPAARARDIKAVVDQLKLAPVVLVGATMAVQEIAAYVEQFGTETVAAFVLVNGVATGNFDPTMTPALLNYVAAIQKERPAATERFVRNQFQKP